MTYDEDDQAVHTAIHEAAHAVVAFWFGMRLDDRGADLDVPICGVRCEVFQDTEQADIMINLAGWQAEVIITSLAYTRSDDELYQTIDCIRLGFDDEDGSDDWLTFQRLIKQYPDQSDVDLIARYRGYEVLTRDLLLKPIVWNAVNNIAAALILHRRVDSATASRLLAGGISWGYLTGSEGPAI